MLSISLLFIEELYLADSPSSDEERAKRFDLDINAAYSRLKKTAIKRELKDLTEQIKLAEMQKDGPLAEKLTQKVSTLSKELINL